MTLTHRDTPFFYAGPEARFYDQTARMTGRSYGASHEVASRCLAVLGGRRSHTSAPLILDLGCGTGEEAFRILEKLPNARIICIDISQEMLQICREKARARFGEKPSADQLVF